MNDNSYNQEEILMLEIKDTLISLDLIERYFCCDLDACLGACCIEGDAGAPVTQAEVRSLEQVLPLIKDQLTPAARQILEDQGVSYIDEEGDLVTSIVNGRDCCFTCYDKGGKCLCAVEKAHAQGKTTFRKPASCALYPVRLTRYPTFTAVNLHRWKICCPAEKLGRRLGLRAYRFLEKPLTEYFGKEWYDELCLAADVYLKENPGK